MAHTTFRRILIITILLILIGTYVVLNHTSIQLIVWQILQNIVVICVEQMFHRYTCCAAYSEINNTSNDLCLVPNESCEECI